MSETTVKHLPEQPVEGKRLGRHIRHDEQSRGYQATRASAIISVRHATAGLPLDQGQIGSCTANALCGAINSAPNRHYRGKIYREHDAVALYELETEMEGQPYPPNDPGGTGLMVCKAAQQLGWISSYQHAFDVVHALQALVLRPVITGVAWYDSFDTPDTDALVSITPDASVRGGHEIVAVELIVPNGGVDPSSASGVLDQILVGLENSWGRSYGKRGRFYWTAATWAALLSQQGDVTVPIV